MRDRYNCRCCGLVVCHPCSESKIPLFQIGINYPVRVCDRCMWDIGSFEDQGIVTPKGDPAVAAATAAGPVGELGGGAVAVAIVDTEAADGTNTTDGSLL
jgi:hypothetical protein